MRATKTSALTKNWFRTIALCLTLGFIIQAGYSFQNEDLSSQEKTSLKETTAVSSGLARPEMEEFLLRAQVVEQKPLAIGVTNSQRALLDDGKLKHDAHIQTVDISKTSFQTARSNELNFRDCYKYNMAAYELDKLLELNMVPVSVERKVGGHRAAVTWWVDDSMLELDRMKRKIAPPDQHLWNQQMYLCRVFDQLIYNTDRNLGNLVITKEWKVWMIDHTRAFRTMKNLENPKNLVQCDRKLLAKLRELNGEVLQQKLGHYLTKTEIDAILSRRDQIVRFFEEQVAQKGETAVLFDLDRSER